MPGAQRPIKDHMEQQPEARQETDIKKALPAYNQAPASIFQFCIPLPKKKKKKASFFFVHDNNFEKKS